MTGEQLTLDLDGWEGPLDVLLSLARSQKVDLRQISILALVEQYLRFIDRAGRMQLELAADYLVMAAWLAYLKSSLLLPRQPDEEPDPEDLALRLQLRLERLAAMREAGARLMARDRMGRDVFSRGAPEGLAVQRKALWQAELYDLIAAYGRINARTRPVMHVVADRQVMTLEAALERVSMLVGSRIDWSAISPWEGVTCFRDAAGDAAVRGLLGGFILMQVAWGGFFVFVSVYLMEAPHLDLTLSQVGLFMAIIGIGFCLSNGLVQPLLAERFAMRTLAVAGLALNALTMVLCLLATSALQAYAAGLLAGITINIAYPSTVTMLSDRVPPGRQGWILGMVGSAAAMGWAISSVVSGVLGGLGHALPVGLAAVLMGGAAAVTMVVGAGQVSVSEARGQCD